MPAFPHPSALPGLLLRAFAALLLPACLAAGAAPQRFEDTIAQRVQACTACHGPQGRAGPDGYYPRIAGKPAGYLYNQLVSFREQRRHYRLMNHLLQGLPDDYLREIAEYFAGLEVPYPPPQPTAGTAEMLQRGRALVTQGDAARGLPACVSCHGAAMTGLAPNIPGLLGLPRDYLNSQLGAWKTRQRQAHAPDCMAQVAQLLATDDVAALSSWLAAQPLPASPKAVSALPEPLPLRCGSAPPPGASGARP
jgi:cytochrome c553